MCVCVCVCVCVSFSVHLLVSCFFGVGAWVGGCSLACAMCGLSVLFVWGSSMGGGGGGGVGECGDRSRAVESQSSLDNLRFLVGNLDPGF